MFPTKCQGQNDRMGRLVISCFRQNLDFSIGFATKISIFTLPPPFAFSLSNQFILQEVCLLRVQYIYIYIYILRASPPAAGPFKVTGTRDLWFCVRFCGIGCAWNRLGVTFREPGDALKNSAGPSDPQEGFMGSNLDFQRFGMQFQRAGDISF